MSLSFRPRKRTLASVLVVILALGATVVVYGITPHDDDISGPFIVRGSIGEPLTGRTLTATVTDVRLASSFDSGDSGDDWTGPTTGTWVVVDADIAAVTEPSTLYRPSLTIGGTTYYASERLSLITLNSVSVRPGIPSRGVLLFEVADSVLESAAASRAEIGLNSSFEAVLDSRLVVEADLRDLPVEKKVELTRPVDVIP